MLSLRSWLIFIGIVLRLPLYRLRLIKQPMFTDHYDASQRVWGQATRWNPRLRVVHPERCPQQGPAIFAGNHVKLDDPFFIWRSVYRATNETMCCQFVMRDDWGRGFPWNILPFTFNDLGTSAGAVPISRGNVQLSQLKPLLHILLDRRAFIIFPGRTRTRTGMVFDYSDQVEEPGGISFFVRHAQRKMPGTQVPVVPVMRTHNPVSWKSAVVFGQPMYLDQEGDKEAQRQFDLDIVANIGALVEVHILHLLCVWIYLRCLHGLHPEMSQDRLKEQMAKIVEKLEHPYVDPRLAAEYEAQLEEALWFLKRRRMLVSADPVIIDRAAVLALPPVGTGFRKRNPVRFYAQEIMHLPRVIRAVEKVVLARR